jgi:hypothetical protein
VADLPATLYEFVRSRPYLVDKKPIDFERHRYLIDPYQAFHFDPRHGSSFDFVLMSAAQVGKSVTIMGGLIYAALKFWSDKFGYFLPDREMADIFSSDRFQPMVASNPTLAILAGEADQRINGLKVKKEDRKRVRSLGASTIFFSYMGGKTSTEAIPMRGIFFDEVRRMRMTDIERASERVSHSDYPINCKVSTAGYPNTDIDHYFLRSDQRVWHVKCRCKHGVVLTDHWPECMGERHGDYFLRCPICDKRIADPQNGQFLPRASEYPTIGFHIPQLISPAMTPRRIWDKWLNATDRQEFYNSTLGLPYVDPETILVPLDVAMACVDHALRWLTKGVNCFIGVDQRGGENHVVLGYTGAGGKLNLAHLEIVQGESPFDRLYELMIQYDVDCCVIDALPSYNEAVKFAKQFKRRVFLSYYSENVHMLRWSDRDEELKTLYRAKPDSKFEFHVMLDRYKSIEYALMYWVNRRVACPTPEALVQKVKVKGLERQSHICLGNPETGEQGLFFHLRSVSRRKLPTLHRDVESKKTVTTGEFRMVWEEIGIDPHFLHAFLYCVMASQRRQVTAELWVPQSGPVVPTVKELQDKRPDLSPTQAGDAAQIQAKILTLPKSSPVPGTCGGCQHFDAGNQKCTPRRFTTQASMPACEMYVEAVPE